MKNTMFQIMVYQYPVSNWDDKKQQIKKFINDENFVRSETFFSDRKISNNSYLKQFSEIFSEELLSFKTELGFNDVMTLTNVWSVKYQKGDFHSVHNHSSTGYSGVLYLEYDEDAHTGTYFVNPQTNPITDLTDYSIPAVHEGSITIVPSNILHFTFPNKSSQIRQIIGFDMKFSKNLDLKIV
jgi:hypothetical protein